VSAPVNSYLDQGLTQAGTRYQTDTSAVLDQQVPNGAPESSDYQVISNGILPSPNVSAQLHHFPAAVYDLSPQSHLSRLIKSVLGDSCMGLISKQYAQARMNDVILTTHFSDLDRFFGDVLGVHRLEAETLPFNPYTDQATPEAWADIHARDASYRARIEQFSRGMNMGGTIEGIETVTEAILGCPVQVYETWTFVDQFASSPGGLLAANIGSNYYSEVVTQTYASLDRQTYADIEGGIGSYGRTTSSNRGEFIVRPMRAITLEENYQLIRVLSRIKPAEALLTVNPSGVALHRPVSLRSVDADSTYWQVKSSVAPSSSQAALYAEGGVTKPVGSSVVQTIPPGQVQQTYERLSSAFSAYQGESYTHNSDIVSLTSYSQVSYPGNVEYQNVDTSRVGTFVTTINEFGTTSHAQVVSTVNWDRDPQQSGFYADRVPDRAIASVYDILLGRLISNGVLSSPPYAVDRFNGAITAYSAFYETGV
jgi:hypothetical protein